MTGFKKEIKYLGETIRWSAIIGLVGVPLYLSIPPFMQHGANFLSKRIDNEEKLKEYAVKVSERLGIEEKDINVRF